MQGDQAGCPTTQVAQEALDTARSGFKKEFFEPSRFMGTLILQKVLFLLRRIIREHG